VDFGLADEHGALWDTARAFVGRDRTSQILRNAIARTVGLRTC
jgi:hypothetical protein